LASAEVFKEILGTIPRFAQEFVNIVSAPRAYGREGQLFDRSRFTPALTFLGISLVATMVLRAPMWAAKDDLFLFLAQDAVWKFLVVVAEAAIIAFVWRILRGTAPAGAYLVANAFYFGVVTILTHVLLLIRWSATRNAPSLAGLEVIVELVVWFCFAMLGAWGLVAWRAYGDVNGATLGKTIMALLLVGVFSLPAVAMGLLLRHALTPNL
jgi:hypothetical protein